MVLSIEVDGRDIASFVKEANEIIQEKVDMPTGYFIEWAGDFKNMQEATQKTYDTSTFISISCNIAIIYCL